MDQQPNGKKREIIAALAVLIVIVIVAGATVASKKKADSSTDMVSKTSTNSTPAATTNNNSTATNDSSSSTGATTSTYKDGTYSATGSYDSPGGSEAITVSVTLQNDVITATSAQNGAGDPEAQEYQNDFISGYKQLIVGKSIASVHLSRVSGSSLTSQGFNSAIQQIESQAKSA